MYFVFYLGSKGAPFFEVDGRGQYILVFTCFQPLTRSKRNKLVFWTYFHRDTLFQLLIAVVYTSKNIWIFKNCTISYILLSLQILFLNFKIVIKLSEFSFYLKFSFVLCCSFFFSVIDSEVFIQ